MKSFLKIVAGFMFFIAATAGALTLLRNFNRQPSVILKSAECNPPCWYGIRPGQTNYSEAYATLADLEGVNKDVIMSDYDSNNKLTDIYWYFERPVEDSGGTIYFDDNRVTAISIFTINSVNLEDLFKKLGQPEQYWTEIGHGENREYLEVTLLYPTKGYAAQVIIDIANNANQVKIQAATPVFAVTYFAPQMFQALLKTRILIDTPSSVRTGTFQTWSGFGIIAFERK